MSLDTATDLDDKDGENAALVWITSAAWALVALAGCLLLRAGGESLGGLKHIGFGAYDAKHQLAYLLAVVPVASILGGLFIGWLCAARIRVHPVRWAVATATIFALAGLTLVPAWACCSGAGFVWLVVADGLIVIPAAWLGARWTAAHW